MDNKLIRHFFIFIDGTKCSPCTDTNIWKMFELFGGVRNANAKYQEGIASTSSFKLFQMLFPTEINTEAYHIYKIIAALGVEASDKLYIFGYSRGAIIARILSQLITNDEARREIVSHINQVVVLNRNTVDFLGLFDPVRGYPYPFKIAGYDPDVYKNHSIKNITEVVSIDEAFPFFRSDSSISNKEKKYISNKDEDLISGPRETSDEKSALNTSVSSRLSRIYCLFPGVHSDVGGQDSNLSLSNIALLLMVKDLLNVYPDTESFINKNIINEISGDLDNDVLLGYRTPFYRKILRFIRTFRADPSTTLHPLAGELEGRKGISGHLIFGKWRKYRVSKSIKK